MRKRGNPKLCDVNEGWWGGRAGNGGTQGLCSTAQEEIGEGRERAVEKAAVKLRGTVIRLFLSVCAVCMLCIQYLLCVPVCVCLVGVCTEYARAMQRGCKANAASAKKQERRRREPEMEPES